MSTFINESVEHGMKNYLNQKNNQPISIIHVYEQKVIEMLIIIYSASCILGPYKLNDEELFKSNLKKYGLLDGEVNYFLINFCEYGKWLNSVNNKKNDIINRINEILMKMAILRNKVIKINPNEMKQLDLFFDPISGSLYRLYQSSLNEPTYSRVKWEHRKNIYFSSPKYGFTKIEPNLLSEDDYRNYGLTINEVKLLPNGKIDEINERILKSVADDNVGGGTTKEKPKQLVLTSGSGFADTLILLGVMATEILVGLVIALISYGG